MAIKAKVPGSYKDPHLHCRTFGHTWHIGESEPDGPVYYRFVLLCEVCYARRIDTLNRRTGAVISRRYEYQPGYQAEPLEGLQRVVYRIEFIKRIQRDR
jgi:hypothetical protein